MIPFLRTVVTVMALALSTTASAFDHRYPAYADLLQKHVQWTADGHASSVDYGALKREHAALTGVLREFTAVKPEEFAGWSRSEQMAFLINAYNAWTLELILSRYPDLKSIRDLGSLLSSPWKKSFVPLLGDTRSLDWIEHERLRPRYRDARVHFAVNCASVGCPALRPEPFLAARLDAQLDDQQQRFLRDRSRNRYIAGSGSLSVSSIFKWYGDDFDVSGKGLAGWLASQAALLADNPADQAQIADGRFKLDYQSYDWHLNDRSPSH